MQMQCGSSAWAMIGNLSLFEWPEQWHIICASLASTMVKQLQHKRHHIVFGGVAKMWDVEPGTFNRRCEL
eukprot:9588759-Prorocentrum_lima.AAC.1